MTVTPRKYTAMDWEKAGGDALRACGLEQRLWGPFPLPPPQPSGKAPAASLMEAEGEVVWEVSEEALGHGPCISFQILGSWSGEAERLPLPASHAAGSQGRWQGPAGSDCIHSPT